MTRQRPTVVSNTRAARRANLTLASKVSIMSKTHGLAMKMKAAKAAAASAPKPSTSTVVTGK